MGEGTQKTAFSWDEIKHNNYWNILLKNETNVFESNQIFGVWLQNRHAVYRYLVCWVKFSWLITYTSNHLQNEDKTIWRWSRWGVNSIVWYYGTDKHSCLHENDKKIRFRGEYWCRYNTQEKNKILVARRKWKYPMSLTSAGSVWNC